MTFDELRQMEPREQSRILAKRGSLPLFESFADLMPLADILAIEQHNQSVFRRIERVLSNSTRTFWIRPTEKGLESNRPLCVEAASLNGKRQWLELDGPKQLPAGQAIAFLRKFGPVAHRKRRGLVEQVTND